MFYKYDKAYIVCHPLDKDRFLVGVRIKHGNNFLPNERLVPDYRMFFTKEINPWGFIGETKESILKYFKEYETCDLYPYPSGFDIYPIERPVKGKTCCERMYIKDLIEDVEQGFDTPLSLDNLAYFSAGYMGNRWNSWFLLSKRFLPDNGIISNGYFFHEEEEEFFKKPYYVIKTHAGYLPIRKDGYVLSIAKQFSDESKALKYACGRANLREKGFEIKEVPPESFDMLWVYSGKKGA